MSNTFAHIQSCRQLNSRIAKSVGEQEDIEQTLELFRRLAEVSRPNDKASSALSILLYLALAARWARERLHIRVERNGVKTLIDLHEMSDSRVGRLLGTFLFNAPFEEFNASLAPKRRTATHEQFFIKMSVALITIERRPAAKSIRPPAPKKKESLRPPTPALSKRASRRPPPPAPNEGESIKKIDGDWE